MEQPIEIPDTVETYHLSTVIATLPIHIFTLLFVLSVFVSILITRHIHSRPRQLFAINCGFFLIASLYDLAFDIGYLIIINKQITVQTCSIVRNFVYNPIAIQGFVDALERFCIAFFDYEMSMITVFSLYSVFPMFCVVIAIYNTFISTTLLQSDDVCAIIRRTKWTNISLVAIQWGSAGIAVILYIAIWRQVQRKRPSINVTSVNPVKSTPPKLCITRYYWDPTIVRVFFICCVLPLVLALPSVIFTFLTDSEIYQNATVNVISIIILDLTTPLTWLAYVCYISHIRLSLAECVCWRGKEQSENSRRINLQVSGRIGTRNKFEPVTLGR